MNLVPYLTAYRNEKTGTEHVFAALQRLHCITAYHLVTEQPEINTDPGQFKELGTDVIQSKALTIASRFQLGISHTPTCRQRRYFKPVDVQRMSFLKQCLTERATPAMQTAPRLTVQTTRLAFV